MINLILEVSKYMMIFLMAVYTWANFRYFSFSDEERKQSICGRQNRVMFLLHFLAYVENTTDECAALYNDRKLDRIHRKVKELKASREWRARYMKFEELLSKEREEGQFAGEKRMLALVRAMLQDNRSDEIPLLETDEKLREELFREYHI